MELACGHCNRALEVPESNFGQKLSCPYCGVRFVVTADRFLFVCPSCGTLHENDSDFCSKCGVKMIGQRHSNESQINKNGSGFGKTVVKIFAGCFLIYFFISLALYGSNFWVKMFADAYYLLSLTGIVEMPKKEEPFVILPCPKCNSDTVVVWKNSYGEVIKQSPNKHCLHCNAYFRIPDKYLHPSKINSPW